MSEQTVSEPTVIQSVEESWHAPGYRDPQFFLVTEQGQRLCFRFSPQAFVEMHNMVCAQQACIDRNEHLPIDIKQYPYNTTHVASLRQVQPRPLPEAKLTEVFNGHLGRMVREV